MAEDYDGFFVDRITGSVCAGSVMADTQSLHNIMLKQTNWQCSGTNSVCGHENSAK